MPALPNLLRFTGLQRSFGRLKVLRDVSGEVVAGSVLRVSGANGTGKSTLLRCLAGLLAPQAGTIECRIDGATLDAADRRHAVGWVAPDLELYDELSVAENLGFFARLRGVPQARGAELLDAVGLDGQRSTATLSSGMRQRLRWAWALLHRPPVLLLDEPLQNLDDDGRRAVLGLLERHLESGLAVVADPGRLELPHVAASLELDG